MKKVKKRPREKNPEENPPDDTRHNRKKTRRDIADLFKRVRGLERRIEQLERRKR